MPTARFVAPIFVALTLSLALALAGQAVADVTLTPHSAVYKVKISIVSGRLDTELRATDDGYIATHVIKPTGLSRLVTRGTMNVSSEFKSFDGGLRPVRFKSVDTIRDDPDVDLGFDWTTSTVAGTVGPDDFEQQLENVSFDNVSIQYRLMEDLLSDSPGDEYVLFDVDKMRVAAVTSAGEKEIKTKAGKFSAVGIRHQKEGSSRITTLWCVEELGYLPVIIEQHRKGKLNFRASLLSYTPNPG